MQMKNIKFLNKFEINEYYYYLRIKKKIFQFYKSLYSAKLKKNCFKQF